MSSITFINEWSAIGKYNSWSSAEKFDSRNRIIGKDGKSVDPYSSANNNAQPYFLLIEKKEYHFTTLERIGRGFLGVVAIICSLGAALLFKSVRNLLTQEKKKIRFAPAVHQDAAKAIYNQYSLQQGVKISPETLAQINNSIENILKNQEGNGVKLLENKRISHKEFSVDTAPGYIFRVNEYSAIKESYDRMTRFKTAYNKTRDNFKHAIVIPHAKLFKLEGTKYGIIAQKKLDAPENRVTEPKDKDLLNALYVHTAHIAFKRICKKDDTLDPDLIKWEGNPVLGIYERFSATTLQKYVGIVNF